MTVSFVDRIIPAKWSDRSIFDDTPSGRVKMIVRSKNNQPKSMP
jgi:hypothetical protein